MPTLQTLSTFRCTNSTFFHCKRVTKPEWVFYPSASLPFSPAMKKESQQDSKLFAFSSLHALPTFIPTASFTHTLFDHCEASNGGGVYLAHCTAQICECSFIACSAIKNGGGVFKSREGELFISHSLFDRCRCGGEGGALFLSLSYIPDGVVFDTVEFRENSVHDVCITPSHPEYSHVINSSSFSHCSSYTLVELPIGIHQHSIPLPFSPHTHKLKRNEKERDSPHIPSVADMNGADTSASCPSQSDYSTVLSVSNTDDSSDTPMCGEPDWWPCSTLTYALSIDRLSSSSTSPCLILLTSGEHSSSTYTATWSDISNVTIASETCGITDTTYIISDGSVNSFELSVNGGTLTFSSFSIRVAVNYSDSSSLFYITSNSTLCLLDMNIYGTSTTTSAGYSLIRPSDSSTIAYNLIINHTTITSFTIPSDPLFVLNASSSSSHASTVSVTYSSFQSITRTDGNGGIFCFTDSQVSITISHNSFKDVSCTNGSGGVMYIFKPTVTIDIHSCTFDTCSASAQGGALCIVAVSVLPVVTQSSFKSCSANAYGGAIYYFNLSQSSDTIVFEALTFCNNSYSNTSGNGADVYLVSVKTNPFKDSVT